MAVEKKRVFIGGLFHGVTEQQVCERFNKFGTVDSVSVQVKTDETGALVNIHYRKFFFNSWHKTQVGHYSSVVRSQDCDLSLPHQAQGYVHSPCTIVYDFLVCAYQILNFNSSVVVLLVYNQNVSVPVIGYVFFVVKFLTWKYKHVTFTGQPVKTFAYVDITASEKSLRQCK